MMKKATLARVSAVMIDMGSKRPTARAYRRVFARRATNRMRTRVAIATTAFRLGEVKRSFHFGRLERGGPSSGGDFGTFHT